MFCGLLNSKASHQIISRKCERKGKKKKKKQKDRRKKEKNKKKGYIYKKSSLCTRRPEQ